MSLRKPFIIVGDRCTPTCRRTDCDPNVQPSHWTDTELTSEARRALKLFPQLVELLTEMAKTAIPDKRAKSLIRRAKAILSEEVR